MADDIVIQKMKENDKLIDQLARLGGALDSLVFVQMQLRAMVELLFTTTEDLEKLEISYQDKVNEVLLGAMKQAREARILIDQAQKGLVTPQKPQLIKPVEK